MHRRAFLQIIVATAGASLLDTGCSDDPKPVIREVVDGTVFFPQGVASGDPRPTSVILWARVDDPEAQGDLSLELEVARDEAFTDRVTLDVAQVKAETAFDRCVKIKVKGLAPGAVYYYRFGYDKGGKLHVSRTARTKTAPAEDADAKIRFAFVSCQDRIGRFYNPYALMLEEQLDFFVHLGDYIYETTGDKKFQEAGSARGIVFTKPEDAIVVDAGKPSEYRAARSLSNYRDIYRQYRSDPVLQKVHEKYPMIAIWDDHEYSNDCYGASGTYFADRKDENDVARRKAANQVWFEYMPVDYDSESYRYDPAASFPGDIKIYRDFVFGKHVHLVMTDERTYRSDHPIPEGAFPGAVILEEAQLAGSGITGEPYVDVDAYQGGVYAAGMKKAAEALGYQADRVKGKITVSFINKLVPEINKVHAPALAEITDVTGLATGISYASLGKSGFHSSFGSRSLVQKPIFDLWSKVVFEQTGGKSQVCMGDAQEAWFLDKIKTSTRTWKVWGNEYCIQPVQVDLRSLPVPATLRQQFYLSLDQWDGQRNRRDVLLREISGIPNVVAITGDVHAFFASTPHVSDDPSKKIVEVVTSSISSGTYSELLKGEVESDPTLGTVTGIDELIANMDNLFTADRFKANPHMGYANSFSNGFAVAEVDGSAFVVTFHLAPLSEAKKDLTGSLDAYRALVKKEVFKVNAGDKELYRQMDGAFKRWDMTQVKWV